MSEAVLNKGESGPEKLPLPRFSWPMRIFLFLLVFDMVFHSLAVLLPIKKWCKEILVDRFPERLPTAEEREKLAHYDEVAAFYLGPGVIAVDKPDPVCERVMKSMDSIWEFFMPWPDSYSRKKIKNWGDGSKFVVCWLTTRLGFFEQLFRIPQRWTMFSPNVGKSDTMVRARLVYEDGSERLVRTSADPVDLTHYGHWWKEKILQYETKLDEDYDARMGWCNLIAHRNRVNDKGSKLVKIYLIKVRIVYPEPDEEDIEEFMRAQNDEDDLHWRTKPPFWEYDVKTREGYRR
jgi:hypothetical protein